MDFKAGIYDASGSGIIGSNDLKLKIKRDSDDLFYDFDDNTFKASGHGTIAAIMVDVNAVNVPGEYEYSVDVTSWNDGIYTCYFQYSGSPAFTDCREFRIHNGQEATPLVPEFSQSMINEVRDAVAEKSIDGSISLEECLKIILAILAGDITRSINTYTFKDQSGTVKLTEVINPDSVIRTIG